MSWKPRDTWRKIHTWRLLLLFVFVLTSSQLISSRSDADIIIPPTAWELLRDRPKTERPVVELPEPVSDDAAISQDVEMPIKPVSDDVSGDVAAKSDDLREDEAGS